MTRRLSAILAADIAGYSRLMGADEAGTLAALRRLRAEVFGPAVAGNRGKIVKAMGDGWLVVFASAVDAVTCAMQVQDRLADDPTIRLRIGVHIGDVTHEEDDIFGDGVNVAARLQEIAEPGFLLVSDAAYGTLDGTLRPSLDDAGERTLKNIERPVRVWVRTPSTAARRGAGIAEAASLRRAGFPDLVIQPVATSDERADVRELADALTSDLDAYLGSVRWLLARTSIHAPEGAYLLRSSLRGREDRLRLESRLFAPGGEQLWLGKFDGSLADSFDWQDRVGEEIVANLIGLVMDAENRTLAGLTPADMTAEQCLLAGMMSFRAARSYPGALAVWARAVEKDPELVEAYAEAIFMVVAIGTVGHSATVGPYTRLLPQWVENARPLAARSGALDVAVAVYDYRQTRDVAPLRAKVHDVLRRAPFEARVLVFCGWGLLWAGEARAALDCFVRHERIGRFDVYAAQAQGGAAIASVMIGDDEGAIAHARRGLEITTGHAPLYRALAAANAHLGRHDAAAAALAEVRRLVPDDSVSFTRARNAYPENMATRRFFDGLRKAGLPE